ncbi:MAG: hypothetical protein K2W95_08405 [Candidatus Obscuribacterales bacterium]|nr:hypothetical protein [Candidatus Obscuribacterales bacterium]
MLNFAGRVSYANADASILPGAIYINRLLHTTREQDGRYCKVSYEIHGILSM